MSERLATIQQIFDAVPLSLDPPQDVIVVGNDHREIIVPSDQFKTYSLCVFLDIYSKINNVALPEIYRSVDNVIIPYSLNRTVNYGYALKLDVLDNTGAQPSDIEVGRDVTSFLSVSDAMPIHPIPSVENILHSRRSNLPIQLKPKFPRLPLTIERDHIPRSLTVSVFTAVCGCNVAIKIQRSKISIYSHLGKIQYNKESAIWRVILPEIESQIKSLNDCIFVGQVCGPNICQNPAGYTQPVFFPYDLLNLNARMFVSTDELNRTCNLIDCFHPLIMERALRFERDFNIWREFASYSSIQNNAGIFIRQQEAAPLESDRIFHYLPSPEKRLRHSNRRL